MGQQVFACTVLSNSLYLVLSIVCQWTAQDIANWKGPYMQTPVDPWGRSYWFDPDYKADPVTNLREDCNETTGTFSSNYNSGLSDIVAVLSVGPITNGWDPPSTNVYDCDDIFLQIYLKI